MARGRLETTVTRRKKGDPAAERVAAAIMEGFSPKTAEEAQEALRSVFGPMIETMLKAELEAHLGHVSVNIFFTISTNIFSPIAPSLFRRSRQRGCAASG